MNDWVSYIVTSSSSRFRVYNSDDEAQVHTIVYLRPELYKDPVGFVILVEIADSAIVLRQALLQSCGNIV